jgi:hypothetical protein
MTADPDRDSSSGQVPWHVIRGDSSGWDDPKMRKRLAHSSQVGGAPEKGWKELHGRGTRLPGPL